MTASSYRLLRARLDGAWHAYRESGSELAKGKLIGLLLAAELSGHSTPKAKSATLSRTLSEMSAKQPGLGERLVEIYKEIPDIAADLERRAVLVGASLVKKAYNMK
jgi:hypothetical protein